MKCSFGKAALWYAENLHWCVIPEHEVIDGGLCSCGKQCKGAGKHPRISAWQTNGSKDPNTIKGWARQWPTANIGILTGAPSGIVVLDIDLPGGPWVLEALEDEHGALPETVQAITGSGGKHLLFKHPGFHVDNDSEGKVIGPDIHIRADGGQIIVAPSVHASGGVYWWEPDHRPLPDRDGMGRVDIAPLPSWILNKLKGAGNSQPQKKQRMSAGEITSLVTSKYKGEAKERHPALTRMAGVLLSRRPPMPSKAILELLVAWDAANCIPPLGAEEVARTFSGILKLRIREKKGGLHVT